MPRFSPRPVRLLLRAAAITVLVAAGSPAWVWPVPAPHPIVKPYLAPATPYSAGHRGIDIAADAGTPVRAPAEGVVHFAGFVVDRPVLSIRHPDGTLSSFEPVEPAVEAGDPVARGQVIGVLLAGHCATPCLHLGARIDGEYISPLLLLGGLPRAILLPMD
jgi:murein DD-endopeptidase MepM/ murein hydrolase activator NlpD